MAWAGLGLLLSLGLAGVVVRFGVLTEPGRALVMRIAEGWRCGPVGRLHVEGLEGDVFGRFTLRRAAIVDPKGDWITARDVAITWRPLEMLQRRFHAERLTTSHLVVIRDPVMEKHRPQPLEPPPIGVRIDAFAGRVETLPAVTVAHGDWNTTGAFLYPRDLHAAGRLSAKSRLRAGDHLDFDFTFTDLKRLQFHADALEVAGGAVAGALGFAANQPFELKAMVESDPNGGRLFADSRSGAERPLFARGRWTPDGGVLNAEARLADSTHTDKYVDRIGPVAKLVMHLDQAGAGHVIDATLSGDFAQAHAHGPVDTDRFRALNVKLDATVKNLAAWFHPPKMDAAQATGFVNGGWTDLVIEARAHAEHLNELDTVIATLDGPVRISHLPGDEWKVATVATATGVGGPGLLAPLLGPHPVATVELSRLHDTRILFRKLNVVGAKIRVDADGAIDLFENLAFKGSFSAPSVAGLRPGSKGALAATFNATSKHNSDFWITHLEGGGTGLATGIAELDRLMGPSPRLTAAATWTPTGWNISQSDLTGASVSASARGTYTTTKAFGLDLDWKARGPFGVGPLEVAGEMKGGGRLTGTLDFPKADLQAQLTSIDFGRLVITPATLKLGLQRVADGGWTGAVGLDGPSAYGPAHAASAFRFAQNGIELSGVDADAGGVKITGALALRDGAPSSADLAVTAGRGAFLSSGTLTGTVKVAGASGGDGRAILALTGRDLTAPGMTASVRKLDLRADGPLERLPYKINAEGGEPTPWSIAGDGVLAKAGEGRELAFSGSGKLKGAPLKTLEPVRVRFGPSERSAHAQLAVAGGRATLDARQADGALTLKALLSNVGVGAFATDYTGTVTGQLDLQGKGRELGGRADLTLAGARSRDAAADLALDGRLQATLASGRLKLDAQATNAQGLKAHTTLDLPAEAAADPFRIAIDRTKPMSGGFDVDGELRPLWDLFAGGDRTLAGRVTARGTIGGSFNNPQVIGQAQLAKGAFRDGPTGLTLKNVEGAAVFGKNVVTVERFRGEDGRGGVLSGDGSASLFREGASSLKLQLQKFQLLDNELGRAQASGAVTVTRDAQGHARLAGQLTVDRADIVAKPPNAAGVVQMDVIEVNGPVSPDGPTPAAARTTSRGAGLVALDVAIRAPQGIFVRGRGLDTELSLDAHVGGTTAAPDLTGTAQIIRGSYDFSGKRFDFVEFGAIHLASKPELIRLDLTAERNEDGLDAKVRVRGTAARPEISLTSIPVLPQDEVLSRVLFGVSASQLSPFEAAGLASAVASLATGGGFDIFGSLRQFAGLDRLTLGGGPAGATVSGGKYVTDSVYLELTGAGTSRGDSPTQLIATGRTGSSATVEWRVRKNLSLVSQAWTGGDVRLSVRFRKNY